MTDSFRLQLRFALVAALAAAPLVCMGAKEFSMPRVQPAAAYPAHDYHPRELVTVALDAYDGPPKSNIFVVNYREANLLPVLLVITNDSDQPIVLSGMKPELVSGSGSKMSPENEDDIYRRVSHPQASGARVPLPFPTKRVKGGVNTKEWNEIQSAQFKAKAVEPRSTQAGFLFFDISGISDPLKDAHFYVTGVRDSSGNDLMYFDVPLDKLKGQSAESNSK
jgi:hypothetical protein